MATLQNESNRRTALEGRLHAQILLQSETLIAMEVKLLKLEAKVEKREAALRRRNILSNLPSVNFGGDSRNSGSVSGGGGGGGSVSGGGVHGSSFPTSRSSGLEHGTIEEEDVFDMTEIRVNTNESHSRGLRTSGGGVGGGGSSSAMGNRFGIGSGTNPTNIAVISSGASLASAVTATSWLEAHDDAHTHGGDDGASGRSADGDVEDEVDNVEDNDGSASSKCRKLRIGRRNMPILFPFIFEFFSKLGTFLLNFCGLNIQ